MSELILASGSPQRKAILEQLGVAFRVVPSGAEELESGPPEEVALENAYRKAMAVSATLPPGSGTAPVILGVDTVVALGSAVYGKPQHSDQARETLLALSGHTHRVISGVCVVEGERHRTAACVTSVTFRDLEPGLLNWYVSGGEWEGRAGGYAIQGRGAMLVSRIEGDYLNVVGLPVQTLVELAPRTLFPAIF